MKNGIIFDLDGTLWNASLQVVPAWNSVLRRYSELNKQICIEDMQGFMGKTISDIARTMFPNIKLEESVKVLEECCKEEQVYLREHGGVLFPNLEETLEILKRNYNLYIVSNCQDGYIQAFLEYHNLNCYFDDFEMSGRTGKSKGENIKIIMNRNELDKAVYVGDTQGDLNAADFAEIPFIFASYGFGNIDKKEVFINSISEIPKIVKKIL